jgi:hypothetical protein
MFVSLSRVIGACLQLDIPWDYLLWVYLHETTSNRGRPRTNTVPYHKVHLKLTSVLRAVDVLIEERILLSRVSRLFSLFYRTGCNYTLNEVPASTRREVMSFLRHHHTYDLVEHPDYLRLVQS